jgi:glycosyltransferase involved in cell wall biosynthesis
LPFELPTGFLLSVVIPVYNEHKTIAGVLARLRALPLPLEIIVVDDESTDGTVEKLEQIRDLTDITVLFKPRNQGKGAALRTGFRHATGDVVVVQDADMEYDPRDIPALIEPIVKKQADIVYGSRFLEHGAVGSSWIHRFGNRFLTRFSNLFTRLRLTDMETCYKAFPRELLQQLELKQHRFGFEPEITAKVARSGATVRELPIRYAARDWQEGKKIGLRDGINAVYCILRYAFLD